MIVTYARQHELTTQKTYIQSYKKPLLNCHGAGNLDLHGFNFRAGITQRRPLFAYTPSVLPATFSDRYDAIAASNWKWHCS
jgi:hypothetical protein